MLGTILQSAGQSNRAEAELNLLKNENAKRIRVESTLSSSRVSEKNAKAGETDETNKKYVDTWYQDKSAQAAKSAAQAGLVAAIVGAVGSIAQSVAGGGGFFEIAGSVISGFFSVAAAYMAYVGAADEAEMIHAQLGHVSKEAKGDQEMLKALDGNPAL